MNKLLTITALLLTLPLFLGSCSKDNPEGKHPTDRRGQLRKIEVMQDNYKFGKPTGDLFPLQTYEFDARGLLIRHEATINPLSPLPAYTTITYTYDTHNRLSESESLLERRTYEYNEIDSVSVERVYIKQGLLHTYEYHYDDNRKLIRKDEDRDTSLPFHYLYTYPDENTVKEEVYVRGDEWLYTNLYKYDDHKNLIRRTDIHPEGKEVDTYIIAYEYNPDGTMGKKTETIAGGIKGTTEYTYTYNEDKTVKNIHVVNQDRNIERDWIYRHTYANEQN